MSHCVCFTNASSFTNHDSLYSHNHPAQLSFPSSSFALCFFSIYSYFYLSPNFSSFPPLLSLSFSSVSHDRLLQLNLSILTFSSICSFSQTEHRNKEKDWEDRHNCERNGERNGETAGDRKAR